MRTINLNDNSFSSLPTDPLDDITTLTTLDISDNGLVSLPTDFFDGLNDLTYLNLRDNQITAIPAGAFHDPAGLQTLIIADKELTDLPDGVFEGLSSLYTLYLAGNPGADFTLSIELEEQDDGTIVATVPEGAPFLLEVGLTSTDATLSNSNLTIDAGSTESAGVTITPNNSQQSTETVSVETVNIVGRKVNRGILPIDRGFLLSG